MRPSSLALLLAILAAPAAGQTLDEKLAAFRTVFDKALAEQRVFLTCSLLEKETFEILSRAWQTDVEEAADMLRDAGVAESDLTQFAVRAAPGRLLTLDAPLSEVRDLCHENSEWMPRLYQLRYTLITLETKKILAGEIGDSAATGDGPAGSEAPFAPPEGPTKSRP